VQRSGVRQVRDGLLAFASLGFVVAVLTVLDERVRSVLIRVTTGDVKVAGVIPDIRVHTLMHTATDLVGRDNATIAGFVVAGGVLFFMMFKM
jgi:hypothetical protein